jgi:hypothetical protein
MALAMIRVGYTVEKTQALFSIKINKQQGWVEGRTFVRLVHLGSVQERSYSRSG